MSSLSSRRWQATEQRDIFDAQTGPQQSHGVAAAAAVGDTGSTTVLMSPVRTS